jgi:hypothetical protein
MILKAAQHFTDIMPFSFHRLNLLLISCCEKLGIGALSNGVIAVVELKESIALVIHFYFK